MLYLNSNISKQNKFIKAENCFIYDDKKNRLFDVWLGAGTLILGHTHMKWECDLCPTSTEIGDDQKKLLDESVPFSPSLLGFQTSGSSGITRACRLARAITNKPKIAVINGYWHGSDDAFLYTSISKPISAGLPEIQDSSVTIYSSMEEFIEAATPKDYAAILVEPHPGSDPSVDNLETLHQSSHRKWLIDNDILLIVDEIITGFRETYGSCLSSRKAQPDIVVFGKTIGGGYPISIVLGSPEVSQRASEKSIFWGGTFSGSGNQIKIMFEQLRVLRNLDYSLISHNFESLKSYIDNIVSSSFHQYTLRHGCSFGKLKNVDSKPTVRGFLDSRSADLPNFLRDHGLYIGANLLVFPSVYNIEDHL